MPRQSTHLPSRFPVGTKFVIEGRPAGDGKVQVFRRFIEFPDGRHVRLPASPDTRKPAAPPAEPAARSVNGRAGASEPIARPAGCDARLLGHWPTDADERRFRKKKGPKALGGSQVVVSGAVKGPSTQPQLVARAGRKAKG